MQGFPCIFLAFNKKMQIYLRISGKKLIFAT